MSPDIVTFNGRAFQYDTHLLKLGKGQRVRIWVLDAGLKRCPRHPAGVLRWSIGIRCSNQMFAKFRADPIPDLVEGCVCVVFCDVPFDCLSSLVGGG